MKTLLNAYVDQQEKFYGEKMNAIAPQLSALNLNINASNSIRDHGNLLTLINNAADAERDQGRKDQILSVRNQVYVLNNLVDNVKKADDVLARI